MPRVTPPPRDDPPWTLGDRWPKCQDRVPMRFRSARRRRKTAAEWPAVTDFLSKETRSRVMARIRSRNTGPELALRRALHAAGVRGWRCHAKHLPGKPDLAFTRWRVAVFVDGCFWHGHPDFFTPGKSGG